MLSLTKVDALMTTQFDKVFGDANVLEGFDYHVWSDGGEWPRLTSTVNLDIKRINKFSWPEQIEVFSDLRNAVNFIVGQFAICDEIAVSMKCGTGKSTKLLAAIVEANYSSSIVCIEPSFLVADALKDYMSHKHTSVACRRDYHADARAITYLSGGEFLSLLHSGVNFDSSLLVVDEYHLINAVYATLNTVISAVKCKVLCLSASDTATLTSRRGVTIYKHKSYDGDFQHRVAEAMSHDGLNRTLLLGAHAGATPIAKSSNHIVGLTLDVDKVIDLGTRMDPVIANNKLIMTYRTASKLETTQSLGRLGRSDTSQNNEFHYLENASVYSLPGRTAYYPRVFAALTSAFGLGPDSNPDTITKVLACLSDNTQKSTKSLNKAKDNRPGSTSSRLTETASIRTSSSSVRSNTSRITPLRDGRERVVTKASYGYMVDDVPKNRFAKMFDTRSSTWCAYPPSADVPLAVERVQHSNVMHAHNEHLNTSKPEVKYSLSANDFLEPDESQNVNEILSGKTIPSFTSEELALVNKAWRVYLAAGNGEVISIDIDRRIRNYYKMFNNYRVVKQKAFEKN